MKLFGIDIRRAEQRAAPTSTISSSASRDEFLAFFGLTPASLPVVTTDTALQLPPVLCAVDFLASCLASLPRHAYRMKDGAADKIGGKLQRIVNEAPNGDWTAFDFWKYMWTQQLTGGRALAYVERSGSQVTGLFPMDPTQTVVKRVGTRKVYEFRGGGRTQTYEPHEVIDLPFLLKPDQLASYSPIKLGEKAIQKGLAIMEFGAGFFAGGGVLPYALEGPLPEGKAGLERAARDIQRAIELAKREGRPFFGMPPGHSLKQIGADPEKGQMVEAANQVVLDVARVWRLPPVFLQDLTHGTFSNTEQQDLALVKHRVAGSARQGDDELNLKLFGADKNSRFIETNLDGLQRGDFLSRINGLARAVQTSLLTPNEGRELDNRPAKPGGDQLLIQGATVPLTMAGKVQVKPQPAEGEPAGDSDAADDKPTRAAQAPVEVHVHVERGGKTRTVVTKHDERGRIAAFEQHEI